MVDLDIRPATVDDALPLYMDLRPCDFDEAFAAAGPDVLPTLRAAITASPLCWTATADGQVVFVVGCAQVRDGLGSPWLMATRAVSRFPKGMTVLSRKVLAVMLESYPALVNFVDARNVASRAWLSYLGFEVAREPEPYGPYGLPFHRFTMGA